VTRYDEFPFPGLPSISELTDASNECRHGRLPFDRGPECGCWNVRRVEVNVYANGLLKVWDGPGDKGSNLMVAASRRQQLFPDEVEELRDALSEWLAAVGREREAA
jgi:hypothetical protein